MHRDNETDTLAEELAALSRAGVEPERDLWPEIEIRIKARRKARGRRRRWLAAAAALVATTLVVVALRDGGAAPSPPLELPAARALPASGSRQLVEAFTSYDRSRRELQEILERRLAAYPSDLAPELITAIEVNLRVIDGAMRNLETALAELPRDEQLEQSLLALYEHELRLLKDLTARLAGSNVAS